MYYYNWDDLKKACFACNKCELCATRTNLVFGVGNPNAEVMFIGEGPGEQEDLKGEPFVGRGGQLLDKMLAGVLLFAGYVVVVTDFLGHDGVIEI